MLVHVRLAMGQCSAVSALHVAMRKRGANASRDRRSTRKEHYQLTYFLSIGVSPYLWRLASLLAVKRDQPYSLVLSWLRCNLSFLSIAICHHLPQRSSLLRGAPSTYWSPGPCSQRGTSAPNSINSIKLSFLFLFFILALVAHFCIT